MPDLQLWWRRLIGLTWLLAWSGLLYLSVRPWRDLGGLVSERSRWLVRLALYAGLALGFVAGEIVRGPAGRRRNAAKFGRRLRWLLYPAALAGTAGMLLLQATRRHDSIGILLTGLLSYAAGASTSYLGLNRFCRGPGRESDRQSGSTEPASLRRTRVDGVECVAARRRKPTVGPDV